MPSFPRGPAAATQMGCPTEREATHEDVGFVEQTVQCLLAFFLCRLKIYVPHLCELRFQFRKERVVEWHATVHLRVRARLTARK